ncbi:solute carrier family 35 (GDP-fucose transporter), member C1 [Entomortierella parvispora]|uniref:Solute carrier family 35 (GDP-fucose transporter), member C1 n=1 Tax=Entomortierella parvispora TaxID=205924 RepID=A0A9P3H553_9FUNG|nr:solute carrier family 35 (GDP-fucose transporter), member C1 [Entomortierella parvispora]
MSSKREEDFLPTPALHRAPVEHSVSRIFSAIAFYWVASLSVVFLNKTILSGSEFKFPYPLFVTLFQLVVALVLLVVCGEWGKRSRTFSMIPPFEFDLDIAAKIAPLSIIYVLMLTLNNLCLQLVEVTFYQVARSLSIFFNILLTWVLLRQPTSLGAMFACSVVVLGFFVGSYGETNFSWPGLLAGVGSSIFVALYGIYVKKTLAVIDNNQWRLLHYNTAISIGLLGVLTLFSGELKEIREEVYFLGDLGFWFLMTLTGVAGFLINTAMFLQIKYTTALTNTISGTAKSCVQTLMAMVFYQNPITAMNGFGIFLSLLGSGLYSWVRYAEMQRRN